jgi:mycothiol synthase
MKTVKVNSANVKDFISYCVKYAKEQDESFIPRDDFIPGVDEPAYMLMNGNNKPVGAASVMLHKEFREIKKGRFRIFHCIDKTYDNYKMLFDSIIGQCDGIDNLFCFITEDKTDVCKIWEDLGFKIKRYSWVLERGTEEANPVNLPEGYELRIMNNNSHEENAWCGIINSAFADIEGHTHMRPERIAEMRKEKEYMEEGMRIVWNGEKPAGLIKLIKINEEGEDILFIETLAVHRSFQGNGLGKTLLKYGVNFGKDMGIKKTMLTVNAENDNAVKLYLNEGFEKTVVYICYNIKL